MSRGKLINRNDNIKSDEKARQDDVSVHSLRLRYIWICQNHKLKKHRPVIDPCDSTDEINDTQALYQLISIKNTALCFTTYEKRSARNGNWTQTTQYC